MRRMFTSAATAIGVTATLFAAAPCDAGQQYPTYTYHYNTPYSHYTQHSTKYSPSSPYTFRQYFYDQHMDAKRLYNRNMNNYWDSKRLYGR
jgi:hypothetical protein